MISYKVLIAVAASVVSCAADAGVAGKWNCMNVQLTGDESPWTLLLRQNGAKLSGALTDGAIDLALLEVKAADGTLTFRFDINGKPYGFEGKLDGKKLEGNYSGEEARGKLRCQKADK